MKVKKTTGHSYETTSQRRILKKHLETRSFNDENAHHNVRAAKVRMATVRPTRGSKASADAPLPAGLEVDDAFAEPVEEVAMLVESLEGVLVVLMREVTAEEAGTMAEADKETLPPAAVPDAGAATALEGSTRFPVPQGMGSFDPGCWAFAGGVVAPVEAAIVKRVVQALTLVCGEENW